ncbi:tripartite tricarboxylate transporter substrate binding protein [Aquincola sp. S2]|uniref:Tripartite tricarboxylate transporter substrate binding protein n=1 Tax=Pseudaquabacterium terrae TaxID=2732868 RepID=A0ABX2EGM5_9BURK|nr:tripartite tricarboxylate transporter substrate-binding protein [Aquabacterium terrae]NRF67773.1 tripartite tricarboxylate transporter substrate binding protein [Aquabacterium terrae]
MSISTLRRALVATAAAALATGASSVAVAQSGPLRVILPVGAGSGVDTIMRAAQSALSKALGGQISVIGETPFVLVINPSKVAAKNAKELQAFLQARPGGYNYASSGNGTIIHLAGEMFIDAAGVDVKHIPYKGVGPMVADLIGGQVELGAVALPAVQGHLKSGALRAIGVMGRQRVASLPDLPTIAEQGFPEVDVAGWFAVVAPAKLPAAQVKRLHDAVTTAFNDPEVKATMAKQENIIHPSTPEAALQFFKSEQERSAKLVKKSGISLD